MPCTKGLVLVKNLLNNKQKQHFESVIVSFHGMFTFVKNWLHLAIFCFLFLRFHSKYLFLKFQCCVYLHNSPDLTLKSTILHHFFNLYMIKVNFFQWFPSNSRWYSSGNADPFILNNTGYLKMWSDTSKKKMFRVSTSNTYKTENCKIYFS